MVRTLSKIFENVDSQISKDNIFQDAPIYFLIFFEVFLKREEGTYQYLHVLHV